MNNSYAGTTALPMSYTFLHEKCPCFQMSLDHLKEFHERIDTRSASYAEGSYYDISASLLPPFMLSNAAGITTYSCPEGDGGRKMIQVVVPCAYSLPSASVKRPSAVAM